jgi:hypothetical protein
LSKIKQPRKNRFGSPVGYAFLGKGFPTKESAFECGTRLKQAISILMAKRRLGINVGKDRATSASDIAMKDMLKEKHGVQLRDDIHGLDVYSEDPPVTRFSLFATATVSHEIKDFQVPLTNLYASELSFSAKQQLALEIYNLTHFEGAIKTRFLTLITVIEVLAERDKRSPAIREFLKSLSKHVSGSTLSKDEKKQLADGFGNLKRNSISESCRKLIAKYASGSDVEYFMNCYKARSELVHDGITQRLEADDPTRLDELVCQVLISNLTQTA